MSNIPISNCSSGSETLAATRNYCRDLTVSHGGIALKSSCASTVSYVLAFRSLPTSLYRTLHLLSSLLLTSTQRTGVGLIPLAIAVCPSTLSYNLINSHHPMSSARQARIYSGGNTFPDMSSKCCSMFSQLSCACSNGSMSSDGTRPASFKSNSLTVPSSDTSPFTASKINLVSTGCLSFSQMRHGICEFQAVKPFAMLSEFNHQRLRECTHLLESVLPSSMSRNCPCATFVPGTPLANSFPLFTTSSHKQ